MIYYLIYQLGVLIFSYLPLKAAYKLAIIISDLHYLFAKKDRGNVAANLKVIFPNKSYSEIKAIRLKMFRNFAKYLVDFFRLSKLNKENLDKFVQIENLDYLDQALAKGKGVITLAAHIGNWELAAAALALSGYSIGIVVLPHRHKSVDDFFNSQRQKKGIIVMPLGKAVSQCLKLLHKNKIIALMGDRTFTAAGKLIDFFGLPTYLPKGPAAFSLKTGAQIIPTFMFRNPDDKFTLKFEKPIEFTSSGDKEKDLTGLLFKCKSIIEKYILRYPEQWFMFRKFWLENHKTEPEA
ncbi:MAG: lysophospholipid acyltransferase family protein [Candidatus Omnitrophota bacterium]